MVFKKPWLMSSENYLFQAYLEFFTSKENVESLRDVLPNFPNVNYHIINCRVSKATTKFSI